MNYLLEVSDNTRRDHGEEAKGVTVELFKRFFQHNQASNRSETATTPHISQYTFWKPISATLEKKHALLNHNYDIKCQ